GWQAALCRKVRDLSYVPADQRDETVGSRSGRFFERFVEIVGTPHLQRVKLDAQLPRRELDTFPGGGCPDSAPWIPEHGYERKLGDNFFKQLQILFSPQLRRIEGGPRDVTPRPRQALNKPQFDRSGHLCHDDGDRLAHPLDHADRTSLGNNDLDLETEQLG